MRVLVVEDEPEVRDFLCRVIRGAAWAVDTAQDGAGALAQLGTADYDLAVLDVGLPDLDGFEVCRRMRRRGDRTPVLVLTARNAVDDRVRGLDAGADDYLAKPFDVAELLARLRALARRPAVSLDPVLTIADLTLDPATRRVQRANVSLGLTAREFALLEYLMRHAGRPVTREMICEHVWRTPFDPTTNIVDVYITYVRRKLDTDPEAPLLETVRGVGYRMRPG